MPNQVVLAKKQQNLKFNAYYATVLLLVTGMLGCFASAAALALTSGQWMYFVFSSVMLIWAVWTLGAAYISIPLTIYLNHKYAQKKYSELDVAHSRALKVLMQLPLRKTSDVPVLMSNLALMRLCQGQYDSAEQLFRQATEYIAKDKRLNSTFAAAILINNLGCACMRLGNLAEAEVHANKAIEIFELKKNKSWRIALSLPYSLLGVVHAKFGEYDTAEEHFLKSKQFVETEKPPAGTISTSFAQGKIQMLLWLSYTQFKQGKLKEGELNCDSAIAMVAADHEGVNTLTLEILMLLANELMNLKQFERAEKLLDVAYAIAADSPYHPDAKQVLNYFEKLLLLTDRQSEVADMRNWLRHVDHKALTVI